MILNMKSFTTGQAFIKSVEDGISSNSEISTSAKALICASDFWIAIKTKVMTFWDLESLGTKPGSTTMNQSVHARVWNETSLNAGQKKV